MRVLAFEDGYDVAELLEQGGVDVAALDLTQRWTTEHAIPTIEDLAPEVLLLDHFIPPTTGLEVLRALNGAVSEGRCARPDQVIAMSSMKRANDAMLAEGADVGLVKPLIATWDGWPRQ